MRRKLLAQRRKGAKRYRVSKEFSLRLCAFAREIFSQGMIGERASNSKRGDTGLQRLEVHRRICLLSPRANVFRLRTDRR